MKIKVGDKLPQNDFFYLDDANEVKKISTNDLFTAEKIIILGMPGAFTKTCSTIHLPGYIKNYNLAKKKGVTKIICLAVNDPNVMKAWGQNQNVQKTSQQHLKTIKAKYTYNQLLIQIFSTAKKYARNGYNP